MRALCLALVLFGCARPQGAPAGRGAAKARVREHSLIERARVAEVITAAGDVRAAVFADGGWFLGTSGGVVRASRALVEEARFTTLDGLPSNDVWALALREDELLIGTAAGLTSARVGGGRLFAFTTLAVAPSSVRELVVIDATAYLGTFGGGVYRCDGDELGELALTDGAPSGVRATERITRLRSDGLRLWVGTVDHGVARVELAERRVRWFPLGSPSPPVRDLEPTPDGALVATADGLFAIEGDQTTAPTPGDPLATRDVLALADFRGQTVAVRPSAVSEWRHRVGVGLEADGVSLLRTSDLARVRRLVPALSWTTGATPAGAGLLAIGQDGAQLVGQPTPGAAAPAETSAPLSASGPLRVLARLVPVGLPSPEVTALALTDDGALDAIAGGRAVRIVHLADTLEVTPYATDRRLPPASGAVLYRGRVFSVVPGGLAIDGATTPLSVADGLPAAEVTALAAGEDGVWVGTRGGLARVTVDKGP